jgi:hypothetical protein
MSDIQIYIICHNQESFDFAPKDDRFKYILVGNDVKFPKNISTNRLIIPCTLPRHIEHFKSLLTFTAWYALAKNFITNTKFVGIFEYDIKFKTDPFKLDVELNENTIYGCFKRDLPDQLYLDAVPFLKDKMLPFSADVALQQKFWCPTSNFIVPVTFLKEFVDWYMDIVPKILENKQHPHFHERAINVYAANFGFKTEVINLIDHLQFNSHQYTL